MVGSDGCAHICRFGFIWGNIKVIRLADTTLFTFHISHFTFFCIFARDIIIYLRGQRAMNNSKLKKI